MIESSFNNYKISDELLKSIKLLGFENPKNKEMVNKNVNIIEENNHNDCNRLIQIETFVNIREVTILFFYLC